MTGNHAVAAITQVVVTVMLSWITLAIGVHHVSRRNLLVPCCSAVLLVTALIGGAHGG